MALKIGAGDRESIHRHARETYPEECSGLIVGMDTGEMKVVVDVWPAENTHEDERKRRFLIDPMDYMKLEERATERDLDVLGIYHSHPDHPAEPSEYDRDHALPGWSYIITSVREDGIKDTRSWILRDDRSGYNEESLAE